MSTAANAGSSLGDVLSVSLADPFTDMNHDQEVEIIVEEQGQTEVSVGECLSSKSIVVMTPSMPKEQREKAFFCPCCLKGFTSKKGLIKHICRNQDKKRSMCKKYICAVCSKTLSSPHTLQQHMVLHDEHREHYQCSVCYSMFDTLIKYRKHQRVHVPCTLHVCGVCDQQFSDRYALGRHLLSHSAYANYTCVHCSKAYKHKRQLDEHMLGHSLLRHKCDICGKLFTLKRKLMLHLKIHNKELDFICSRCGKAYVNLAALNRHSKSHENPKAFSCDVCSAGFVARYQLMVHKKRCHVDDLQLAVEQCRIESDADCGAAHAGTQRCNRTSTKQTCEVCGQQVAGQLARHMRLHSNHKPYQCETCNTSFRQSNDLAQHKLTHLNISPYGCALCERSFRKLSNLMRHFKTHKRDDENGQVFMCGVCKWKCDGKGDLAKHSKLHINSTA